MKYFPLTVVDDFFPDVNSVLELAKSVEYNPPGNTAFPGVTSKLLINNIDRGLFQWILRKTLGIFWDLKFKEVYVDAEMDFQRIDPYSDPNHLLNRGLIHHETETRAASLIYLNENPSENSGTSFFKLKKEYQYYDENDPEYATFVNSTAKYHGGNAVDNLEEIISNHLNKYSETARVQAQQNRMAFYSPEMWHSQTTYGSKTRYTLRCFYNSISIRDNSGNMMREVDLPLLRAS